MQQVMTLYGNRALLEGLLKHGARFLVVGGIAVHLHDPARNIDGSDLDLLIESTPKNAKHVICALYNLELAPDFTEDSISSSALSRQHLPLKTQRFFADILTTGPDIDFAHEWEQANEAMVNGQRVRYASIDLLIRMKEGSERRKDQEDVARLKMLVD
ncbi:MULTISPECIES: hypothetical protein [Pseudomonas]|jgi:predicted nucleotidyltransferase|uniref:hypothetical protein n=1 Tax=Pseudomonas TaxID=286 RepID=UPI0018D6D10A|nr:MULTISPECIES: hypothetical protein [Pseudomonas]MBH3373408.1 hypothetical protein [Pseudomonas juntendi]MBS6039458.1 hypothetical protein [Pseudomonas sp.]CAH0646787.1 hypothetical protein PSNVIR_01037 [Pseudomonas sp. Nvir]